MPKPNFTHLHVHSHYSLLDGLSKIDEILDKCEKDGMKAVALTDHGVMYGVIEFYQKALARGIRPIVGMEAYIASNGMHNKRAKIDEERYHLTLLAKNDKGYHNLMELTTLGHLEGFYYRPRIDYDLLEHYAEGIICLSGCLSGQVAKLILSGKFDEAKTLALRLKKIFNRGDFYLEVQKHPGLHDQDIANEGLFKLAKELELPLVATHDSHYINPEDATAQDILLAVQTGNKVDDEDRMTMKNHDFSMPSPETMADYFKDHTEAIKNTEEIAQKCNLKIELGKIHLPKFDVPEGEDENAYLKKLVNIGIEKRLKKEAESPKVKERLSNEL